MRTCTVISATTTLMSIIALACGSPAIAADLPQSRRLALHSGWKGIGEVVQMGKNHVFGAGNFWGVTFNDAGSGPFHKGAASCLYTLELVNGAGQAQGPCIFRDHDGDKVFTSWSGKIATSGALDGVHKINGGTGKFNGIQGQGLFQCIALGDKSQHSCTQQFDYSVPAAANR